jgi:epoxyqueuosine reductase
MRLKDMECLNDMFSFFEKNNTRITNIDIEDLKELKNEIDNNYRLGLISEYIYNRYLKKLNYDIPKEFPNAKSIFLLIYPQTLKKVGFLYKNKKYNFDVPPQYEYKFDDSYCSKINSFINKLGYKAVKIEKVPPLKLLAVKSGIGKYGKNNIVYVKGMGSYNRIILFYSDYKSKNKTFLKDVEFMKNCDKCLVCKNSCPTNLITNKNEIIDAKNCITRLNESLEDFPTWFDKKNMNCLIGCMKCQSKCPMNLRYKDNITYNEVFDEEETDFILKNINCKDIPIKTYKKLENLGLVEYIPIISRNLKVLFKNQLKYEIF